MQVFVTLKQESDFISSLHPQSGERNPGASELGVPLLCRVPGWNAGFCVSLQPSSTLIFISGIGEKEVVGQVLGSAQGSLSPCSL